MKRIRFNIASLVVVILVVGVSFAALKEANDPWDSGIFTVSIGVLLTTVVLGIHRNGAKRAFWIGFALFGWIYLALTFFPSIEPRLLTTQALAYLDSKVPGRSPGVFTIRLTGTGSGATGNQVQNVAFSIDGKQLATANQGEVRIWDVASGRLVGGFGGTTENFVRIGHSLLTMLTAWFGGLLSRRLWRASRAPQEQGERVIEGTNK
jgi:hypothetical protein